MDGGDFVGPKRSVVNRNLVEQSFEIAIVNDRGIVARRSPAVIRSKGQKTFRVHGRNRSGARRGFSSGLPIDVKLQLRSIVGAGDVMPFAGRDQGSAVV